VLCCSWAGITHSSKIAASSLAELSRETFLFAFTAGKSVSRFNSRARGRVLEQMPELTLAKGPKLGLCTQKLDIVNCWEAMTRESQGPDGARHEADRNHFLNLFSKVRGYPCCRLLPVLVRRHDALRDLSVCGLTFWHCL
jgi:hypothetical protein